MEEEKIVNIVSRVISEEREKKKINKKRLIKIKTRYNN